MPFPYLLWRDASRMAVGEGGFHFVNIMPANVPLKHIRSRRGYRRLAQLPHIKSDPKAKSKSKSRSKG